MLECIVVAAAGAKGSVHQVRIKGMVLPQTSPEGDVIKGEGKDMKVGQSCT
jgi:hypothetical protein